MSTRSTAGTRAVPQPGPPSRQPSPMISRRCCGGYRCAHIRRHGPEAIATAKAQRRDPAGGAPRTLLSQEVAGRERSALATRRAAVAFPTGKAFDARNTEVLSIAAPTQRALRTLEWVHRRENLVVCGPYGTEKTFLHEALG